MFFARLGIYASTFSSLRAQIADETGINGIAIRLTALNPDGTVLYSRAVSYTHLHRNIYICHFNLLSNRCIILSVLLNRNNFTTQPCNIQ